MDFKILLFLFSLVVARAYRIEYNKLYQDSGYESEDKYGAAYKNDYNHGDNKDYDHKKVNGYEHGYEDYSGHDYSDYDYSDYEYGDFDYNDYDYSDHVYSDYDYSDNDYSDYDYSDHDYSDHDYSDYDYSDHDYSDHDYSDYDYNDYDYSDHDYNDYDYSDFDYNDHDYSDHDYNDYDYSDTDFSDHDYSDYSDYDYNDHDYSVYDYSDFDYSDYDYSDYDYSDYDYGDYDYSDYDYSDYDYSDYDYSDNDYSDYDYQNKRYKSYDGKLWKDSYDLSYYSKTDYGRTDVDIILDIISETNVDTCSGDAENIVDLKVNVSIWDEDRTLAIYNANFWSRRLNLPTFDNIQEMVLNNFVTTAVISNPKVYAAALVFTEDRFERDRLLAPYAYRDGEMVKVFDLSEGYDYLTAHWFKLMEDSTPEDVSSIQVEATMSTGEIVTEEVLYALAVDGQWSQPYFDCGGGNIWMMSYVAPIFGPDGQGNQIFSGIASIDIDLQNLDINQCDGKDYADGIFYSIFKGSHRCPKESKCIFEAGYGLRRGGYRCECKDGTTIDGEFLEGASQENLSHISCPRKSYKKKKY